MRVAILDDYQQVALASADWSAVRERAEIHVFTTHIGRTEALVNALEPFDVIVAMRERTPFDAERLGGLPRLRLLVTTGMSNASIDLDAAAARGITVCGTGGVGSSTAELTWGLILALLRHIPTEDRWMKTAGRAGGAALGPPGRLHPPVFLGNVPEQGQDEPPGQFGRRGPDPARAAHGDSAQGRRIQVDGRVGHAGGDQQPQPREPAQPLGVERGPLPHRHDDIERLQRVDQRLGPRDVRGENVDLGPFPDRGPVRTGQRNLLIIIEDRDPHAPTLSVPAARLATVSP